RSSTGSPRAPCSSPDASFVRTRMDALSVLADDLTGACEVGAEFLPAPGGVVVQPALETREPAPRGATCVRNTPSRTLARARAAGAGVLVWGAETDADLKRAVRTLLLRGRPLLLVGSTGLACALRRVPGAEQAGRAVCPAGSVPLPGDGVLVVAGSAHPATRRQLERAADRGLVHPIEVASLAGAEWAGARAARALASGMVPALIAPAAASPEGGAAVLAALRRAALTTLARERPGGLGLGGGETAYHVLEGLGLPPLWLESRLCPLVVWARLMVGAWAGLAVVTKGGRPS